MTDQNKKLWVFDTWEFFEIYAPDLADAERQANDIASAIGIDLRLVDNWREYQEENAGQSEVMT